MTMLAGVVAWVLSSSLTLGPSSILGDPQAQAVFEEAQAAFEAKDFAAASKLLERAYMLEPNPVLLYPWAQAERNLDHCAVAIDLYRQFIESAPSQRMVDDAQKNIERCEESLAAAEPEPAPEPEPAVDPEPPPRPKDPTPPTDAPDDKPVGRDAAGAVLVSLGAVGLVVGTALAVTAAKKAKVAHEADDNLAYLDARKSALGLRAGGIASLVVGGALVLAGVIRYGVLARKRGRGDVALLLPRGGAGLAWSGRF